MRINRIVWGVGNNFPLERYLFCSWFCVLKNVFALSVLCKPMDNFARILFRNCSVRGQLWRWVLLLILVIRYDVWAMQQAAKCWSLGPFLEIGSRMSNTIAYMNYLPDLSKVSTSGNFPAATRSCLSSRGSASKDWDRSSRFAMVCSRLVTLPIKFDTFLSKICAGHWVLRRTG